MYSTALSVCCEEETLKSENIFILFCNVLQKSLFWGVSSSVILGGKESLSMNRDTKGRGKKGYVNCKSQLYLFFLKFLYF